MKNLLKSYPYIIFLLVLVVASLACNLATKAEEDNNYLVVTERPAIVLLAPPAQATASTPPAEGSTPVPYAAGSTVILHAVASDLGDGISHVEFVIQAPGEDIVLTVVPETTNPKRWEAATTWQANGYQTYIIEARAFRNHEGTLMPSNTEYSLIEVVSVCNARHPENKRALDEDRPAVALLSPSHTAVYRSAESVTLAAQVFDGVGADYLEFRIEAPGIEPIVLAQPLEEDAKQCGLVTLSWQATEAQRYTVSVQAYREESSEDIVASNTTQVDIVVRGAGQDVQTIGTVEATEDLTPLATLSPTEEITPVDTSLAVETSPATISAAEAPIRQGPGPTYETVTELSEGAEIEILGRSTDAMWYAININNGVGWVFMTLVNFDGDINSLPVIAAPE